MSRLSGNCAVLYREPRLGTHGHDRLDDRVTLFIPFGIAILRDRGALPLFPRWLGFFNFWIALLILPALLLPFFKSRPFAYNGIVALYLPFGAFFIWMVVMTFGLMRAIRTQQ
jgi:hypothetical protein